jgi:DNA-binding Xre family transcriptional regulator
VQNTLEKQLSTYLRKKRGDMTFAEFSRKLGLTPSTLHRLEQCQQSITLRSLQQIMERLKCDLSDIFNCRDS